MNAFPKRQLHDLAIFGGPKAFKEKLHVGAPNVGNRESLLQRIEAILGTRWLTNNGPYVQEFEKLLAEKTGVKHCLAICNGTIALEIAIRALDLSGEVIVPSFTFVSTAHALQWHGIKPVFCDIDPRTHNIDPCQIESLITERTSGIMAVLREKGLVLVTSDGERLPATGATVCDLKDALPQDLVVLAVKAYDLPAVAVDLPRICHEDTIVLPMQNGLPWWYFQCHPEPWSGRRIECLDPDGSLARSIPPERILGSVVYPAAEVVEPGIVRHVEGHRIVVGELDDRETDRAATIIEMTFAVKFGSSF
jgi:hypothetical protein